MEQSNPSNQKNYHLNQKRWMLEMTIFLLGILLAGISMAQNVTINDANFKSYLVGNTAINTNMDTEIQVSEATAFNGSILCNNLAISDLTGVEAFTNATELNAAQNDLTSVDLSANTALTSLYLSFNDLTSVDVSFNLSLTTLYVNNNSLTSLDVSDNALITTLDISNNNISTINLSENTALDWLRAYGNNLTSLDLTENTLLTHVDIAENGTTSIDLTDLTLLEYFGSNSNALTALDVSNNTQLKELYLFNNNLTSIDVTSNTQLTHLGVANNTGITSLDLTQNSMLTELDASGTGITTIDLSNNTSLDVLTITDCNLSAIDVTSLTQLTELYVYSTLIEEIDLTQNTNLVYLDIEYNQLYAIDISQNTLLEDAILNGNTPLVHLNAANGNNENLYLEVDTSPNLDCIQVSNVTYADANWTKDADASFSLDCPGPFELVSLTPTNGAVEVSKDSDLTFTFSHDADIGAGNIQVYRVSNDALVTQLSNYNATFMTIDGSSVTFDFPVDFPQGKELYVQVSDGYLRSDLFSEDWEGYQTTTGWTFTVADTRPQILSFTPTTEVASGQVELEITYDRDIALSTGTIPALRVYNSSDSQVAFFNKNNSNIVIDGATATMTITYPLDADEDYYVLMTEGLFVDASDTGNGGEDIDDSSVWTFSTRINDGNGPNISSLSPANGATQVERSGINVEFTVTYDEPVYLGSTSGEVLLYREDPAGDVLYYNIGNIASISEDNLTVTFDIPNGYNMIADTEYYVLMDAVDGSSRPIIYDADGNGITAIDNENTWRFTTYGPIEITDFDPDNGATEVPVDQIFSLVTNNNLDISGSGTIRLRNYETGSIQRTIIMPSADVETEGNELNISFNAIGGDLEEGKHYYIDIASGVFRDQWNQTFTTSHKDTWNFTTEDNTAPTIVSLFPTDDNDNVSLTSNFIIDFSENIELGDGNITLYNENDELIETYSMTENFARLTLGFNDITIDPTEDLVEGMGYYIQIDNDAVKDDDGFNNYFTGILDNTTWNFSTPDNTAPAFVSSSPEDEATDVAIDTDISITFDEDIVGNLTASNQIRLGLASGPLVEAFTDMSLASVAGNTITINPTEDLEYDTEYIVYFQYGAVQDASGNNATAFDWTFSTGIEPDETAPSIAERSPAIDASGVATDAHLILTYDEAVQLTGSGLFRMYDRSNDQLIGTIWAFDSGATIDGNVVTYDIPMDIPYGTEVYIEIENAVEDLAGNPADDILGNNDWYFTIEGEMDAPVLVSQSPTDGADNVPVDTHLVMTFDEVVQLTGSGSFRMYNKANDEQIGVNWSFAPGASVDGNTVTYDIPIDLPYATEVYFVISNAIEDVWGNDFAPISGNDGWVVTTEDEPDAVAPTIVSLMPADDATKVPVDTDFVIEFSEPVNVGSGSIRMHFYSNNSSSQSIDVTSENVTIDGNTVTIDPPLNLMTGIDYWIGISSGAFEDAAGNEFAGINSGNKDDWNFTTNDTAPNPPAVVLQSPTNGSADVAVDTELSAVFNENVMLGVNGTTKQLVIQRVNGGGGNFAVIPITSEMIQGDKLTIPHDDFELDITYRIILNDGVITDLDNNAFSGFSGSDWTFTTEGKEIQNITFESISDKIFGDANFNLTASASSGLDVVFSVVSGPVSIDGSTVTIEGAGTAVIAANQGGNDDYQAAEEVTQTFNIAKTDQTITIVSIDDKLTSDAPFEVVASVDTGLELDYEVTGPASISGTTITLSGTPGNVTVTVSQSGNDNYNEASASESFLVADPAKDNQTITFESISDKTFGDPSFDLTATASSGLGVTFSVVSGPVSINGATVSILGAGTAVIAANQSGDDSFNPASEVTQSFEINKADQTITVEAIEDKLTTDAPFDIIASVDTGLDLDYAVSGPATISGTTVTLEGTAGMVTVTVSQAGNDNYNAASMSTSFEVSDPAKTNQTITFETIPNKTFGDDSFSLTATASSGLDVTFSVVSGPISLSGNTVAIEGAGTAVIAANQSGNDDFNPASEVTQTFEISKADQTITIVAIDDKLTTDEPFEIEANTDSGLELMITLSGPASLSGSTITLNGTTGTVELIVSQAGDDNYNEASASISFEVLEPTAPLGFGDEIKMKFYPNPTRDVLNLEIGEVAEVRIIGQDGSVILKKEMSYGKLDLSSLSSGVLILEVKTSTSTIRERIIRKAN